MSDAGPAAGDAARPDRDGEKHRGQGAVLGVRVIRYGGAQGLAIGAASAIHLATIFVVAAYLGPSDLGRFAVLFFGANLLAHLLTIAVKPGTIRRTFGAGDDDDDDEGEDDDDETSASPKRSLGTGLMLALLLAGVGAVVAIVLRRPIAEGLLGDPADADLIVWTAILGATTVLSRLVSIVIWFERRPSAFLVCELLRPFLGLVVAVILLATGAGLEAVLIGATAGTVLAAVVGFVVLRHSFEASFDLGEVGAILHRGALRAPVMMSFWTIVNADVFLLSRSVSDADLGIYTLASRVAFVSAFLPQAFRVALRPLRKAAIYQAVEEQYGRAEQRGQLLGYFVLLCVSAILAMALLGPAIVELAPSSFGDAAPLIPATAAAMVWPALLRTVNQQTMWPGRTRNTFIACSVGAALLFIGLTLLLAPGIGIYAAPLGMVAGLAPPSLYLFIRCQRGPDRIAFPYREIGTAVAAALALGGAFYLIPELPVVWELAVALAFGALYIASLFVLRVVPESHWEALTHMARSLVSGKPDEFKPRRGLRALDQGERDALRAAVEASWATGAARAGAEGPPPDDGEALMRSLRRAAERGGVPLPPPDEHEGAIAEYVFSSAPTAVRNVEMRKLLDAGVDAGELRTLEDLVAHLAVIPDGAWRIESASGN